MLNTPAATAAPVAPPHTRASASPAPTARAARTIDASGVERTAATGSGALAIETGASTTRTPSGTSPSSAAGANSSTRVPRPAAMAAAAATSRGPRSAPFASAATVTGSARGLVVVVIVVGRGRLHLAPGIRPAVGTHAMRETRLMAVRALVQARRRDPVLGAALARPGARLLLLGDGHGGARGYRTRSPSSRSFAQRGSGSRSWACPGSWFRLTPHVGHRPAHAGRHRIWAGSARTSASWAQARRSSSAPDET